MESKLWGFLSGNSDIQIRFIAYTQLHKCQICLCMHREGIYDVMSVSLISFTDQWAN